MRGNGTESKVRRRNSIEMDVYDTEEGMLITIFTFYHNFSIFFVLIYTQLKTKRTLFVYIYVENLQ